jgi:3-hydroxyisobutyrate dehydrogenase-like beta-hydroxyacid dehydrogenase
VITVGVLYPGDMGSALARRLVDAGWRAVAWLDERSARTHALAQAAGVEALASLDEVVAQADLVVSLVPQHAVVATAAACAAAVGRTGARPFYLDANSVAPQTAGAAVALAAAAGCEAVDGAFVGSAASLGGQTMLYLSGPSAPRLGALLEPALRVRVLGAEVGLASAFKLSFAGFNKGLVALVLEAAAAADRLGLRGELLDCLANSYPGSMASVERLLPSYPRHATRRVEEFDEVARWLASIGQAGPMAAATRVVLERLSELRLADDVEWRTADLIAECCRRQILAERGIDTGGESAGRVDAGSVDAAGGGA